MPSLERKIVAGAQFSFSSNSLSGVESSEDFGLAFGEWNGWTGWHCDNEPDWLSKEDCKSPSSLEHFSPTSRVQAIGRYKNDMLELVKDMPEYAYELSLRDLVELPRIVRMARESPVKERLQKSKPRTGGEEKVKKAGSRHLRSGSMESGGFLLKMFFPIPSSGKKRSGGGSSGSLKPGSRSSSSGSSSSSSSSSSTETPKSGRGSRGSSKPLMKDGRKPSAAKSSEKKHVDMQPHGALSRNCSRQYQSGCYPFFLNQNKSRTRKILW